MAMQEVDIRKFLPKFGETGSQSAARIAQNWMERTINPSDVEENLSSAREDYRELIKLEPPTTLSYSPLRASAGLIEFKARRDISRAISLAAGENKEYLEQFYEGMGEITWAIVATEDAIATGERDQVIREAEFELADFPPDDVGLYRNEYYRFARMLVARRTKRLLSDHSGKYLVEGEYHDMKAIFGGEVPYPARLGWGFTPDWSEANVRGAHFARDLYMRTIGVAEHLYDGSVFNIQGIEIRRPQTIQNLVSRAKTL